MESKDCRFTIGYTYYDEPELLLEQISLWNKYPHQIEIILVDDGSQNYPAYDIVKDLELPNFHLYVVDEDLGFNSHGCRNLISKVASCDFILFSDIDCQFAPEVIAFLKRVSFNPEKLYKFCMYATKSFEYFPWPSHPNVFIIDRYKFWEAGGYDESFTGWHSGDREFMDRLSTVTEKSQVTEHLGFSLVRGARSLWIDASVTKITYDNEKMIITMPKNMPDNLSGTVKEKINFSYSQLL